MYVEVREKPCGAGSLLPLYKGSRNGTWVARLVRQLLSEPSAPPPPALKR